MCEPKYSWSSDKGDKEYLEVGCEEGELSIGGRDCEVGLVGMGHVVKVYE